LNDFMSKAAATPQLVPARVRPGLGQPSQISPADPAVHYHVLVNAPGGGGATIRLGLESLSYTGWPLPNKGVDFAPVRAVSTNVLASLDIRLRTNCDAPIREFIAYRMSSDPASPYYNRYLS